MFKNLRNMLHANGGFSLLEILIVMVIIAILAAIAIPAFISYRDHARMAVLIEAGNSLRGALASLAANHADSLYPPDVTIATLNTNGASLTASHYTLTYAQTGTPVGSSYTLLLEHSATGQQVCVTPARTHKTAAGVCS